MKLKFLLLIIFSLSFFAQYEAQRRSTSVKGYTRKDGTYVRPHTRNYNSRSSYSSKSYTSPYLSDFDENSSKSKNLISGQYLTSTSKYNGNKIEKSNLTSIQNSDVDVIDGNVIYLSVLYYNDKIIDICPISKNIIDNWAFDEVNHSFNKNSITPENALDLISNYGWRVNDEKISKSFRYTSTYDEGLPNYLVKKFEAIKLK